MKIKRNNVVILLIILFCIVFQNFDNYVNASSYDNYVNGYPITEYEENINELSSNSSLNNGQVEVIKSVDYLDDGTFDISLKSQGKSYTATYKDDAVYNIEMVIDNSGSMYNVPSRIVNTVNAINQIIRKYASYPNVNIGVIAYSGVNTLVSKPAYVMLKLGHYNYSSEDYITTSNGYYDGGPVSWLDRDTVRWLTVNTSQNGSQKGFAVHPGETYMQAGIVLAHQELAAATNKDNATPILFLMTDGAQNSYSYEGSDTNPVYNLETLEDLLKCGQRHNGDIYENNALPAYATIRQAIYTKQKLSSIYAGDCLMYTFGFDLYDTTYPVSVEYAISALNPTKANIDKLKNFMNSGREAYSIYSYIYNDINSGELTWDDVLYTDGYVEGSSASSVVNTLDDILNKKVVSEVSPINKDSYITITDEIGAGYEITNNNEKVQMELQINGTSKNIELSSTDGNVYTYNDDIVSVEYNKNSNIVTFKVKGNYYLNKSANIKFNVSPKDDIEAEIEGKKYYTNVNTEYSFKANSSNPVYKGATVTENIDTSGSITLTKIPAKLKIEYIDECNNDIIETEYKNGYIKDVVNTEAKNIEGYRVYRKPEKEEYVLQEDEIVVQYYYKKVSNVVTRYVDVNTSLDIDKSQNTTVEYMEGEDYTTQQKEFDGYRATGATQNTSGTVEREDIEVIYYYKKLAGGVEGIYREELHPENEIYARFNQTGLEKDAYNVPSRLIEGYALTNTIGNPVGEMTVEKITVIYEYRKLVGVTERHIDTNTGKDIVTPERREYQEQTEYSTSSKEIPGYRLVVTPANAEGTVGQEDFEVVYEYKKISEGVETRFVDQVTGAEIESRVMQEGLEGEEYTTAPKVIEGYTQVGTPSNAKGEFKEELTVVTYEYRKNSKVIVHHVDENTGREIIDPTETTYKEGDRYTALPQSIEGYVVTKEPEQKEGVIGRENIEVTYYYKKGSAGLTVKYVDEQTGDLLDQKEYTGNENDVIQLEEKSFENYVLVLKPKKSEVVLTVEAQEEIYYYRRIVKLDIEGIVQGTDEVLYTSSQNGIEGDKYTTTPMEIPGYTLVVTPDNATGVYSRNSEKVVYEYSNKKAGRVVVKYVDEETGKTIEEVVIDGFDGDKYETEKKEYEDYNFKRVEGDPRGEIKEGEEVVTYYYERKAGKVIVTYEDEEGNTVLQEEMNGKVKEQYKVEEKQIPGYEIVERPDNAEGQYKDGTVEVKYKVRRKTGKVKVNFKDEEGNEIYPSIEGEGYVGEDFYLKIPEKEGYYVDGDKEIRVKYEEGEIVIDVIYLKEEVEIPDTGDISLITVFTILALSIFEIKYNLRSVNNK